MKLVSSLACCLSSLQREMQRAFWSSLSSLGTDLAEMHLMFKLSAKMRWTVPVWQSYYLTNLVDSLPMICKDSLANFCYVFWCCAWRPSPRTLISSTDVRPSLKRLCHKKVLLWLMALSPKASCRIWWVSAAVFLRLKQNLMQILCSLKSVIPVVKIIRQITKT